MAGRKQTASVKAFANSYPASPMQQEMLYRSLSAPHSGADVDQILCRLPAALNGVAFRQAWERVVQRHVILRSGFRASGLQGRQEVHRQVRLHFEQKDWRGLTERERAGRMDAYLQAERRRGFELNVPPLMRLVLFHEGNAKHVLAWTFHRLLLDERACVAVLAEVFALYEASCQAHHAGLRARRSSHDYFDWLRKGGRSYAGAFWRAELKGFNVRERFVSGSAKRDRYECDEVQQAGLSRPVTARLRWVAKQNDLLQSAEDLPVLNQTDQRQPDADWNETETHFLLCPQDKYSHELFETQVERTPYAVALVYSKGEVSYRELDNQDNRVAFHLRSLESGQMLISVRRAAPDERGHRVASLQPYPFPSSNRGAAMGSHN